MTRLSRKVGPQHLEDATGAGNGRIALSPFQSDSIPENSAKTFKVYSSLLFDPKSKSWLENQTITIDPISGLITNLSSRFSPEIELSQPSDIDLRHLTLLPGLVDSHTHIFLHAYTSTPSFYQERDESPVERTLRAANHARKALLAGYTTYRDLGTEGLASADASFRDAINRGIVPGPRLFVATLPLASSGGYEIRIEASANGSRVPELADACDGADGVRAAVRRRIGAGADVVKVYGDYRKRALRWPEGPWPGAAPVRFPPPAALRGAAYLQFTDEEMAAIVVEARRNGAPVAVHAGSGEAVLQAARAGATTVEHALEWGQEALEAMKEHGTILVPTLATVEAVYPAKLGECSERLRLAHRHGVTLACGGDTGVFDHGENVRELELFLEADIPLEDTLVAATVNGWAACGGDWTGRLFGWWEEGVAADIVGLDGDPRSDLGALRRVVFVMKDGTVWKEDGKAVGMV